MFGLGVIIGIIIGILIQLFITKKLMYYIGEHPELIKDVVDNSTEKVLNIVNDEVVAKVINKFIFSHGLSDTRELIKPYMLTNSIRKLVED